MSDESFDIIFRGKLQSGHVLADVKLKLMQLFKSDACKIDALFSGSAIPLKRNIDDASAKKYQAILTKAGIVVDIVNPALTVSAATASAEPTSAKIDPEAIRAARLAEQAQRRAERKAAQVKEVPSAKTLSMAERLAQAETESSVKSEIPVATSAVLPVDDSGSHLTLAAAGADVLSESERSHIDPVEVDTSALNLREGDGELLGDSERAEDVVLDLDLREYNLAQVGEDLLQEGERVVIASVEVDTSQLVLDDVGGELLHADEKPVAEVVEVNISAMDLAPAGSDLGQLKGSKPAVNPDISKISLAP